MMGTRRKDESWEDWRERDNREKRERYASDSEYRKRNYEYTKQRRQDPEVRKRTAATARARLDRPGEREKDRLKRKARTYGVTVDQLISLVQGTCGICGGGNNGRTLHIDHDHRCCDGARSCGKCIRGVLCYPCNYGYERFLDSPRVIAYLMKSEAGRATLNRD